MQVTRKSKFYQITVKFLLCSLLFTSLAPALPAQAREAMPQALVSEVQTVEGIQELSLPIPEKILDTPDIIEEPVVEEPEQYLDQVFDDDVYGESLLTTTQEGELHFNKNEEKGFNILNGLGIQETNSGAFVYNYPLSIPSGRLNMQPDLSLSYNSQSQDNENLFGLGWSLDIPYIERYSDNGKDKLYDSVEFISSMSGKLLYIDSGSGPDGLYGPEIESGSFIKYEFTQEGYWIATDKMGIKYRFGYQATSRQDNPSDSSKVYKWLLDEVRDTNDNYIKYEYYKDSGQIYPYKIKYTGYGSTDGIFEIEFIRESRSDVSEHYYPLFQVKTNYIIDEIIVKIDGEWVNKYDMQYTVNSGQYLSFLEEIKESARDKDGVIEIYPETKINYNNLFSGWNEKQTYDAPRVFIDYNGDKGVRLSDVNGDGLVDWVQSYHSIGGDINEVYINNGSGWTLDTSWTVPEFFASVGTDTGARLVDVNGDGLVDIVRSFWYNYGDPVNKVYINNGSGWTLDTSWTLPVYITNNSNVDYGVRLADVNGDGLVDVLYGFWYTVGDPENEVYINNGSGWTLDENWVLPQLFSGNLTRDRGVRLADINGDGLVDILRAVWYNNPSQDINLTYLNTGTGWEIATSTWQLPNFFTNASDNSERALRIADVNGDNLPDFITSTNNQENYVYINNGSGWERNFDYDIPLDILFDSVDNGVRLADVNGDGMTDIIKAKDDVVNNRYFQANAEKPTLEKIKESSGSNILVDYKASTQDRDYANNLKSPELFSIIYTVDNIQIKNDNGNDVDISYDYKDGLYYSDELGKRKFTGFGEIKKTIDDKSIKTYYHQANGVDAQQEENADSYYRIGRAYKTEIIDDTTENLLQKSLYKWDEYDLGNDRKFIYDSQYSNTDFTDTVVSVAKQKDFDYSNGNVDIEHDLGEVSINTTTGEILNQLLGDEKDTEFEYAENISKHILSAPKIRTISDDLDSKEQKLYYDNSEVLGYVDKVNLTKENYVEDNVELTRQFNSYGLVEKEISPEKATTTIAYDSLNLYPYTATNDLNQITYTEYDLFAGQVATTTAPNGLITKNIYDSFGRLERVEVSDVNNPSFTILKSEYIYQDADVNYIYSDTGWLHPTANSRYFDDFTNPEEVYASDDVYAEGVVPSNSETYQSYENFNISIPSGARITGVEAKIEHRLGTTLTNVYEYLNYYSENSGIWSNPKGFMYSGTDQVSILGGDGDTWGLDPISTDFDNSNFSIYYMGTLKSASGNVDTFIDDIQIRVYYVTEQKDIAYKETKNYFDTNSYTTSREYYDGLDRVIQKKANTATASEYTTVDILYDSQGRVVHQSLPYITSTLEYTTANLSQPAKTYTYDALDRVLSESTPTGITSYEYDGFKTTITDANGIQKELTKDAYGNLVEVKEHNSNNVYTTDYEYTLTNKLKKITDSQGNIRNFHYDALDNLDWQDMVHKSSVIDPKKIQYSHDKNGNVLTETSFKGDAISYVYDDLNRITHEKLSDVDQITYTYDQNNDVGQLSFVDYGLGNSKAYDYDILGRLRTATTTIESESFVMKYDYNLNGDIKEIEYPNSWKVSYGFNSIGQVNSVALDKGQGAVNIASNIEYNQNGQMTHLERANGVITDYTYDPNESFHLTDLDTVVGSTSLQNIHYDYDSIGNITQISDSSDTDLAKTVNYDYDDLNRLISSTVSYITHPNDNYTRTYDYDSIGDMIYNSELGTMNYDNDNPHQLSFYGTRSFVYDDAGNMTRNGVSKLSWDWRNRLKGSYDIASENNTYYQYDHNNQRFLKYTEELVFIPPDLENPISLFSMTPMAVSGGTYELQRVKEDKYVDDYFEKNLNDHTRTHINLNNIKLATVKDNDDPYFILGDHLGSSSILTDATGTISELSDYLPFGKISYESTTTDLGDDYTFTGQEYDEESDLQYYGARYLDNELGRFLSVEPVMLVLHDGNQVKKILGQELQKILLDPQALNSYAYSKNNPVVLVDIDGNWFWEVITGQQSWDDFQIELGQAVNQLCEDSPTWNAVIDHPVESGIIIGVGSGLAAWGASSAITWGLTETGLMTGGTTATTLAGNYGNKLVDKLNISGFRPTQDYINIQKVNEYVNILYSGGKLQPIEVIENNGIKYITEGHHRFIASQIANMSIDIIGRTGTLIGTSWDKIEAVSQYIDKY